MDDEKLESLSYRELQKLCKENGIKGCNKNREHLKNELLKLNLSKEDLLFDDSIALGNKRNHHNENKITTHDQSKGTKRFALSDISDLTGNTPTPSCKKHVDSNISVGSSLFSEFECSLRAISSTPSRINSCTKSNITTSKENDLMTFSSKVFVTEEKYDQLISKFEASAKAVYEQIEAQRTELERERCSGNDYLNVILKQELSNKEKELSSKYNNEINQLQKEQTVLEDQCIQQKNEYEVIVKDLNENITNMDEEISQLKNDNRAIKDKYLELDTTNKRTINELRDEKVVLVNTLQTKNEGYSILEEERNQLRELVKELNGKILLKDNEIKKQTEMVQAVNYIPNNTIMVDMEDEFACIICQELFINAITLPCGHSFCEQCLRTWFKTKKTCPVCRRNVKLKAIPSVVLDSAVEKLIESMDEETKRKRMQLKRERNEQKRTEDAGPDHHGIRAMFHSVDGSATASTNGSQTPVRNAATNNVARRRSRSQSPARNLNQRVINAASTLNQRANNILNQLRTNTNNNNATNATNATNSNNNRGNYNPQWNQWRNNNNGYSTMNNHGSGYQGRNPHVRCFRCGTNGHVASQCPSRR